LVFFFGKVQAYHSPFGTSYVMVNAKAISEEMFHSKSKARRSGGQLNAKEFIPTLQRIAPLE